MMPYELRPYQENSVSAALDAIRTVNGTGIVLPTGAGKSLVIAEIAHRAAVKWQARTFILAHRKELLVQNAEKVRSQLPLGITCGVFSAGLRMYSMDDNIICGGIQSVYKRAADFGRIHQVIIDEAHLLPDEDDGMYHQFINGLREFNPKLKIIGLTATPYRTSTGLIYGNDKILSSICYETKVQDLIADGYLCPVTTSPVEEIYNTSGLHVRGGEYITSEVESLFNDDGKTLAACQEIVSKCRDRNSILIFSSGVSHAEHITRIIESITGERCHCVTGETSALERSATLESFKNQQIRWLVNVDVLTTGFDAPCVDAIAVLRATLSPGLFAQMCGRGFRLHAGKKDCIAEGMRVLTDQGLVEIQNVTTEMKLWDGVEFASHCGIILRGELPVISYCGITATEDHNVWTKEGWKTIGECFRKQIEIASTGYEGTPIREADGCFRRVNSQGKIENFFIDEMHYVQQRRPEVLGQFKQGCRRMQEVRADSSQNDSVSRCTKMASFAMYCSKVSLRKRKLQPLPKLRWERNQVSIQISERNGEMDNGQSRIKQIEANRPHQQRWSLRSWKSSARESISKHEQSEKKLWNKENAQIQNESSRNKICRFNPCGTNQSGVKRQRNRREIQSEIIQTKRVWDIVNAGPRNRFTCEGLLVSNCVILDYGNNVKRHGPIDSDEYGVKQKKVEVEQEGDTRNCPVCEIELPREARKCECGYEFPNPQKKCPACQSYVSISTKSCKCGWLFNNIDTFSDSSSQILAKPEKWMVASVQVDRHVKRSDPDAPNTLKVTYWADKYGDEPGDVSTRQICEWVCLEHPPGFARGKAVKWWNERCVEEAIDIDDAISLFARGAVAPTLAITTIKDGKFDRIIDYVLDDKPTDYLPESNEEELTDLPF